MEMERLEKIEKLRERAQVTYDEARKPWNRPAETCWTP